MLENGIIGKVMVQEGILQEMGNYMWYSNYQ